MIKRILTVIFLVFLTFGIGLKALNAEPAPFFGCISAGEWLCACEVPGVGWQALECSLMEDKEGKQKWIDHCGGDAEKAKIQWLWDMAKRDGRVDPTCCGGQNVCGSFLFPTRAPVQIEEKYTEEYREEPIPEPTIEEIVPTLKKQPQRQKSLNTPLRFREERAKKEQEFITTPEEQSFSLPSFKITLPRVNLMKLNQNAKKPLGFFERVFRTIVSYDKRLENWINARIGIIIRK